MAHPGRSGLAEVTASQRKRLAGRQALLWRRLEAVAQADIKAGDVFNHHLVFTSQSKRLTQLQLSADTNGAAGFLFLALEGVGAVISSSSVRFCDLTR